MTSAWSAERARRLGPLLANATVLPIVLAVILAGVAALGGADYERTRPSVYESSTTLLLDSPLAITANPGVVLAVSEVRGKYAGLVGTDVISQPAAKQSGLPLDQVAHSVAAALGPANLDIVLRARGSSPQQAAALATAVAQSLIGYLHAEQAALPAAINPQLRLTMKVISQAYPGNRVQPNHRREITTGAIVGVIVGLLAYGAGRLAYELGRRSVRT